MSEAICRAWERRIPRAGASIDTLPPKLIRGQPIPGVIAINVVVGGSDAPTRSEPIEAGLAVHNSATRGMLHVNGDTDGAECTTTTAVAHRRRVPPWAPRRAAAELLGTAHRGTELPLSEPRTPVPTARAQR